MSIDELAGLYADLRRAGMTPPEVLDRSPLTLGESLAAPMERANPSTFPWQATQWRLRWGRDGLTAHGLVTQLRASGDDGWQAICYGPGGLAMPAVSFSSAEDARAAVEEHILAHVDTGLSEETE